MAGFSLSLTWLGEELEQYWLAPADTAAFRRGETSSPPALDGHRRMEEQESIARSGTEASEASRAAATIARRVIAAMTRVVVENEEKLGQIDAVAGEGDHGIGMARGTRAAQGAAEATDGGICDILVAAGDDFADKAGGTSGLLWGVSLSPVGAALGNTDDVTADRLRDAVPHGAETMQRVGKAERGDKTMLDVLLPLVDTLHRRLDEGRAWSTRGGRPLPPPSRRAPPLPPWERGSGGPGRWPSAVRGRRDAGAVSMRLVLTAIGEVLAQSLDSTSTNHLVDVTDAAGGPQRRRSQ